MGPNKAFRKNKPKGMVYIHALVITIITFSSLCFISVMSLLFFDPLSKAISFEMTDIYSFIISQREDSLYSDKITIVTVDDVSERDEIAHVIQKVNECHPRVVGLDIIFTYPLSHGSDSLLISTIKQMENIVLPCILSAENEGVYTTKESTFFTDSLHSLQEGFVNFAGNKPGIVRRFIPSVKYKKREQPVETVYSFAASLLKLYDEDHFRHVISRDNGRPDLINYYPQVFDTISANEILKYADRIKDRIVFIGYDSQTEDMHYTPSTNAMSGMEIHAYTLATMLNDNYIREWDNGWTKILVFFICYLFSLACYLLLQKVNSGAGCIIRIIQTILIFFCLRAGYFIFLNYSVNTHYIPLLLAIGFTSFFADIYCGICLWGGKLKSKIKKMYNDHKSATS